MKRSESAQKPAPKAVARPSSSVGESTVPQEVCHHCSKDLLTDDRALFVEEEVGRVFCSEECITEYFAPEVERLEKAYLKHLSNSDLTGEEREKFSHLRWITLQEPDEVWREKTLNGDYRYTLISEFQPGPRPIWSVCICLCLRGEPSFLYMAFPTKNAAMVDYYRKGERVEWQKPSPSQETRERTESSQNRRHLIDGLADEWTAEETLRAQLMGHQRRADDIPGEEYHLYEACINETLEAPDEVWSMATRGEDGPRLYHFIRYYGDEDPGFWMIIAARETEDDHEQIEILDLFPTRDAELVGRYRQGEQEVGSKAPVVSTRMVH